MIWFVGGRKFLARFFFCLGVLLFVTFWWTLSHCEAMGRLRCTLCPGDWILISTL